MLELTDDELTGAAYALLDAFLRDDEEAAASLERDVGGPALAVAFGILFEALGHDRVAELIDMWRQRAVS